MITLPFLDELLLNPRDGKEKTIEKNGQQKARIRRRKEKLAKASRKINRGK